MIIIEAEAEVRASEFLSVMLLVDVASAFRSGRYSARLVGASPALAVHPAFYLAGEFMAGRRRRRVSP